MMHARGLIELGGCPTPKRHQSQRLLEGCRSSGALGNKENALISNLEPVRLLRQPMISPRKRQECSHARAGPPLIAQRQNASRGRMRLSQESIRRFCQSHHKRPASFQIFIEDELIFYCERCATQLASQGFSIQRLDCSLPEEAVPGRPPGGLTHLRGNPVFEECVAFLSGLNETLKACVDNLELSAAIGDHYEQQAELVQQLYSQMAAGLEAQRQRHLQLLAQHRLKYEQLLAIQSDHIKGALPEIEAIRDDVEANLESIATDLPEEDFRRCMEGHRHLHAVFAHKVEEHSESLARIYCLSRDQLELKLAKFESFLQALEIPREKYPLLRDVTCISSNERCPEPKGACRTLFEKEDGSTDRKSPQFKNV